MDKSIWRILLVDDDEDDFFITRTTLAAARQGKFLVEWASSYEKGRQMIFAGGYDAVLMDYDLGKQTGIDLVREATAAGFDAPVLLLTGRGTFEIDLAAMEAGVVDYLNKSEINPIFLERSIRYAIEQKRSQQELKAANQALSAANARLAASREEISEMLESISDYFVVVDHQWRIVYLNSRAAEDAEITGDLIGQILWDIYPNLSGTPLSRFYRRVMETRKPGFFEWHDPAPPGRWYEVSAYPTRQGISIYSRDNSEKMLVEQALEQERVLFKTALNQMLSGVIIAEALSGRLILINRQAEMIWRRTFQGSETIEDFNDYRGFFPDGAPYKADDWPLARALHLAEVVRNEEIKISRGDGSFGDILVNSTPIFNAQGKMAAAVMVFFDITERKRSELDTVFLMELGDLINHIEDPQALLDTIADRVAHHLDAARCIISRIGPEPGSLFQEKTHSASPQAVTNDYNFATTSEGVLSELQEGRPVVVRDTDVDPIVSPAARALHQQSEIRSYLSVPLLQGGVLKAALSVFDTRPRNWNERQMVFLQTVAERAWAAYETRLLVAELRSSEERAHQLAGFASASLQKLETVIDSMNEAVIISENGGLSRINPAAAALLGFENADEMKQGVDHIEEIFQAVTLDGQIVPFSEWPHVRASRGETVTSYEMSIHRKDNGLHRVGLFSATPIRDPGGAIVFVLETIVDITPIRLAEQLRGELDMQLQVQHLLVQQREQERLQIARDLHDGPIQNLIGLIFSLQSAEAVAADDTMLRVLSAVRDDAQRLVTELRGVCNELRPPMLDTFGLAKAIRSHAEEVSKRNPGLQLILELDEVPQINAEVRLSLYRIFQEIFNNVIRHASATEATIRLAVEPEQIILKVQDNGVGFELPEDWLSLARNGHLGLVGIKERAEAIGAVLELESSAETGTLIQVKLKQKSI